MPPPSPPTPFIQVTAPAKVNLSLRVLGRRDDGYHEIESLIAPITLQDNLEITLSSPETDVQFTCSDPELSGGENLVVRAARAFFTRSGLPPNARLHLEKRIPHGAGLGGGSSDGAATLRGLNDLHGGILAHGDLHALASALGSDVPFFLAGSAARCTGRGEHVVRAAVPALNLLLLKPPFPVATPWAYGRWEKAHEHAEVPYAGQLVEDLELINDLERPVFEKYLLLPLMKKWLLAQTGVRAALLSGSGSTMFAVLEEERIGEAIAGDAQEEFGQSLWWAECRTTS